MILGPFRNHLESCWALLGHFGVNLGPFGLILHTFGSNSRFFLKKRWGWHGGIGCMEEKKIEGPAIFCPPLFLPTVGIECFS